MEFRTFRCCDCTRELPADQASRDVADGTVCVGCDEIGDEMLDLWVGREAA